MRKLQADRKRGTGVSQIRISDEAEHKAIRRAAMDAGLHAGAFVVQAFHHFRASSAYRRLVDTETKRLQGSTVEFRPRKS